MPVLPVSLPTVWQASFTSQICFSILTSASLITSISALVNAISIIIHLPSTFPNIMTGFSSLLSLLKYDNVQLCFVRACVETKIMLFSFFFLSTSCFSPHVSSFLVSPPYLLHLLPLIDGNICAQLMQWWCNEDVTPAGWKFCQWKGQCVPN